MKYLIIGAGGTGGCIGAYLAKNGADVTLIARGQHKEAIVKNGLRIKSVKTGDFTVKNIKCCTMQEYNGKADVIFICVKYYSLEECIPFTERVSAPDTVVIPLLNIFGTGGEIQPQLSCTVLDGCIYIYSMIESHGIISQPTDIFKVFFGYRKNQPHLQTEKIRLIQKDLENSNIDAFFTEDIETRALKKFSFVSPLGAAGVYYNAVSGDFKVKGEKQDFFTELIKEVCRLADKMGVPLPNDITDTNLKLLYDMEQNGTTSMQRDILNGNRSEFDGLVKRVVTLSEKYGLPAEAYKKVCEKFNR